MESENAATSDLLERPHVFAIGPSWFWLILWAIVAAGMLPWILTNAPAEFSFPWLGTLTLPVGMPLWIAVTAGVCALICSMRCRVVIDERKRSITRWRCIAVFIPWSVKSRSFEEVRFVRLQVHSGFISGILNVLMSMPGEHGEPADPSPVKLGAFLVQLVFVDRDWFNAGRGSARRMIAVGDELCRILDVRRG